MRLAAPETELTIGRETVVLRPTLRAAHLLERRYQGFEALLLAVAGGSLTAISDVIRYGCGQSTELTRYLASIDDQPIGITVGNVTPHLLRFIYELAGVDPDHPVTEDETKPRNPIAFTDYHAKLFQIATGWLGWTPQQAWAATPAEIIEAQRGRMDLLAAIFGSNKDSEGNAADISDPSVRARLNALGDLGVTSMQDVP